MKSHLISKNTCPTSHITNIIVIFVKTKIPQNSLKPDMLILFGEKVRKSNYEMLQKYNMHNDIDSLFYFMNEVKCYYPVILSDIFLTTVNSYLNGRN